jgi:hypothetical protein
MKQFIIEKFHEERIQGTYFKIGRILENVITQAKWAYNQNKNMKMEVGRKSVFKL